MTPQGRAMAFPNVFHHRVSGFELADPTKPGHRRFVALWLVDPYKRIISTANVPPQQAEWFADGVFGEPNGEGADKDKTFLLPPEVVNMARSQLGDWTQPMTREEAEGYREELMAERSQFHDNTRDKWRMDTYSFCEH
ncbi:hypothetical protein C8A05DRAFT_38237 [Staphylotrichum tortipilum]|uniref:DUF4246 domain-containing protein n=1 Tax=Staphylotrichum tortipilum TaxID=2831512 RepID=A0AAN6MCC9_9PEZI|nr:hypothetical protein C8A05DRAFT_38237 [Staphylotrichum longicolle]